ncbi:MAG: helix-turn-helix domain-containing protein [Treponema sp.]|jgi:transcriptional regulator with XRE-family HTH domain|nr:helix-turn-helix domain-containing protein [Treponema sp.]
MGSIREIFARNLKINRRRCGLSQEKLAEKADVSTHYIAILEIARSFPTSAVLERIAGALDIEIYELFLVPHAPNTELTQFREEIRGDMKQLCDEVKQTVDEAIQKALSEKRKD